MASAVTKEKNQTGDAGLTATQQKAFAAKVRESWNVVDELSADVRSQVIDYLIDGKDGTCLLKIAKSFDGPKPFFKKQKYSDVEAINKANGRKLLEAFQIDPAPAGYYQRLGEVAARIPMMKKSAMEPVPELPQWLCDLMKLRQALDDEANMLTPVHRPANKNGLRIQPYLADLGDEYPIDAVVTSLVKAINQDSYLLVTRTLMCADDLNGILEQHPDAIAAGLDSLASEYVIRALQWLRESSMDLSCIAAKVSQIAVGSGTKLRAAALESLTQCADSAVVSLVEILGEGSSSQRGHAVDALAMLAHHLDSTEPIVQALTDALKQEKAKRVRESIQTAVSTLARQDSVDASADSPPPIEFPPIEMPSGELPLPPAFVDAFWRQIQDAEKKLLAEHEKHVLRYAAPDRPSWMNKPGKPLTADRKLFDLAIAKLEGRPGEKFVMDGFLRRATHMVRDWAKWAELKDLHLVHVVRFLDTFDMLRRDRTRVYLYRTDVFDSHRSAQAVPYGLREVDKAFEVAIAVADSPASRLYLTGNNAYSRVFDWPEDSIWPAFAEKPELMRQVLQPGHPDSSTDSRAVAIRVAAMMPTMPPDIEALMWTVALGESKTDRPAARVAVLKLSGATSRGVAALSDGRQAVRIAAAELLADLQDAETVGPLKKALAKEKQELVKGAMLMAIERCGGDVDEFLGKRKQAADAKKGLAKKRPKGMEWVPIDNLPKLRWADDDKPVAAEIVQWWVVQSIQFKLLSCGAILRRSLDMVRPDDVESLARYLLSAWIAHDTVIPTREDVIDEATKTAKQHFKAWPWVQQHYKTEDAYRENLITEMQRTFLNSAIGQKGLLAIVAGAGSVSGTKMGECVKMIERYIRTYHGNRLAQSKALLETLGWFDEPAAIQVLLSLANRFRTKGIQKRAAEMVQEIADRQGWTMDELADRTIPDGGFVREQDQDGNPVGDRAELVLDFGSRKFVVILGDQLEAVITRDDGKTVKALPSAAKDDDPELVKVAKKEFSSAKKTVKEVVKLQAQRLYEAVCVQRSWPADQWNQYLASHPIAGALCRRVIWAATDAAGKTTLFRPLEDRSLTDVQDNEFKLASDAIIRVAHGSLIDDAVVKAWQDHLVDYEVPALFNQFGRQTFRIGPEKAKETEIKDFQGHMLTTFKLRSKATKLGWVRGEPEDGGGFCIYRKAFRSEGLMAILEFTGSYVPEEDLPAGLKTLSFMPWNPNAEQAYSWYGEKMPLGKVAPVLLSECYNDIKEIAAEGTGFDADWEKKGLY